MGQAARCRDNLIWKNSGCLVLCREWYYPVIYSGMVSGMNSGCLEFQTSRWISWNVANCFLFTCSRPNLCNSTDWILIDAIPAFLYARMVWSRLPSETILVLEESTTVPSLKRTWHLKHGGWKMSFPIWEGLSVGAMLISRRVARRLDEIAGQH